MTRSRFMHFIGIILMFGGIIPSNAFASALSGFATKSNHVWYISPAGKKFDLGTSAQAFENAKKVAVKVGGMSDILTLPLSDEMLSMPGEKDGDGDGLSDFFETKTLFALLLDAKKKDTDDDGHDDKTELVNGYNPHGDGKIAVDAIAQKHQGELLLSLEDQMLWYVNASKKLVFFGTSDRFQKAIKKYAVGIPTNVSLGVLPAHDCGIISTNGVSIDVNSSGTSSAKTGDVQGKSAFACFNAAYRACKPATIISVADLLPLADVAMKLEIISKEKSNCKINETVLVDSTGTMGKVGVPDACLFDQKKIKELSIDKWPDHTQISCESDKAKKIAEANKCPLTPMQAEYADVVGSTVDVGVYGYKGGGEHVLVQPSDESIASINSKPDASFTYFDSKKVDVLYFHAKLLQKGSTSATLSDPSLTCTSATKITAYDPLPKQEVALPPGTKDCETGGGFGSDSLKCFTESFTTCAPAQMRHVSGFNSSTSKELWSNTIVGLENGKCKVIAEYLENKVGQDPVHNTRTCLYDNTKPIDTAFRDKSQCKGYISGFTYGTLEW